MPQIKLTTLNRGKIGKPLKGQVDLLRYRAFTLAYESPQAA